MLNLKQMYKGSVAAIKYCFANAPARHVVWTLSELVFVALPFVLVVNWQYILNTLAVTPGLQSIWVNFVVYGAAHLLRLVLNALNTHLDKMSFASMENQRQSKIIDKLTTLDVGKYFDPQFQNAMSVVYAAPDYQTVFHDLLDIATSVAVAVIAFVSIAKFQLIGAIIMILCYIPAVIASAKSAEREYTLHQDMRTNSRKVAYYSSVLTGRTTAAELRLYGLEDLFLSKYKKMWQEVYDAGVKLRVKQMRINGIAKIITPLGLVAIVIGIIIQARAGAFPVGSYALQIGLALTLSGSIETFSVAYMRFKLNVYGCVGRFEEFLQLESSVTDTGERQVDAVPKIEFRDVCFKYPGSDSYVLRGVSFTLMPGERLALVGANGAGKTTLTKLLYRAYTPTTGQILVNDVPASEYDMDSYLAAIGVMLQNVQTYELSLSENIAVYVEESEVESVEAAANAAGVSAIAAKYPHGYETHIGRQLDAQGVELSGGERQKVAAARAFHKRAKLYIFDEPTSALDPEAEDAVFKHIDAIAKNRSAVIISHRLSAVSLCDKVALIENGELAEYGSFRDLIDLDGRFAEMYKRQSEGYSVSAEEGA
jgi:ATP-binding cassette subfamily B protein